MRELCRLFLFTRLCWRAWRLRDAGGPSGCIYYGATAWRGVPDICVLVGFNREAWRVTNLATEAIVTRCRPLSG